MKDNVKQIIEKRTVETVAAVFLVTLIVGTAVASTVTGDNTSDGLVAEYRFNEGGGDIAYDSAGGNDGNFINNPKWVRDSVRGSVLEFDGGGDYVDASPHPFEDESPEEFTASAWFKMEDTPSQSWASVFSTRNGGSGDGFWIFIDSGTFPLDISYSMDFVDSGRVHSSINPSGVINQNQWHHGTVTWDGSEFKAYLDGELVGKYTASGEEAEIADNFFIGWDGNNQYPFPGRIDDTRIYDTALTESAVKSLYNEGSISFSSTPDADSPQPVLGIDFNLIENGEVIDRSGNENHGTIEGAEEKMAVHCQEGRCMEFDGDSDYVSLGEINPDPVFDDMSASAWIKWEGYDGSTAGLLHADNGDYGRIHWELRESSFRLRMEDMDVRPDNPIEPGRWTHVAYSYDHDEGSIRMFKDGEVFFEDENVDSGLIDLDSGGIGRSLSDREFNGKIDNFRIYDQALSRSEIIREAGLQEDGAIASYRFNEHGGDIVFDQSGNGNHGRLQEDIRRVQSERGKVTEFEGSEGNTVETDPVEIPQQYTLSQWVKGDLNEQVDENIYGIGWRSTIALRHASSGEDPLTGILIAEEGDSSSYRSVQTSTNHLDREWNHVVATVDRTKDPIEVKVYLNGELEIEDTIQDHFQDTRSMTLSSWSTTYGHFTGKVSDSKVLRTALSESEVKNLYAEGFSGFRGNGQESGIEEELVLHQSFDRVETCGQDDTISCPDGMSGEVAVDESGEANHGGLNSPDVKGSSSCQVGRCLEFDGESDRVELGDIEEGGSLDVGQEFSVSFWSSPFEEGSGLQGLVSTGGTSNAWNVRNNDGEMQFRVYGQETFTSTKDVEVGEFTHWSFVMDNDAWRWYKNGEQVNSGSNPHDLVYENLYVGRYHGYSTFPGILDEVKISNDAFSREEIWTLYSQGRDRLGSTDMAGPAAHWSMSQPGEELRDVAEGNSGEFNPNLLDNAGFESGDDSTGNMHRIRTNYGGYSEVTDEVSKSGDFSGRHVKTGEDDQWSAVAWDLTNLEEGHSYDFGAWYKCTGDATDADFDVGIYEGTDWSTAERIDLGEYTCDGRWRFASGQSDDLPSGIEDTNRVRFRWGYSTNQGEMYVDDIYLRESDAHWTKTDRGYVLEFDGEDDTVDATNDAWSSDEISVSLWAKTHEDTGTENSNAVFSTDGEDNDLLFQFSSDRLRFWGRTSPESNTALDHDFNVGEWYHLTAVYRYGEPTVEFYIDGKKYERTGDEFGIPGRETFHIGSRTGSSRTFPGQISDVRVYPYALSEEQVKQVMNQGSITFG